jgi:hypothetical protein
MKQLLTLTITILCINAGVRDAEASDQNCRYVSEGSVQQAWKKVRVQKSSTDILGGADTFSEALGLGQSLLESHVCEAQSQDCRMASEGIVAGVWIKHRIQMDGEMVFGADDMATALGQLSSLRRLGFCQ